MDLREEPLALGISAKTLQTQHRGKNMVPKSIHSAMKQKFYSKASRTKQQAV